MKRITQGSAEYLTSTAIADAVLAYSVALARRGRIEVVEIPFRGADEAIHRAQFMVGWTTDVATLSARSGVGDAVDAVDEPDVATLRELHSATTALTGERAVAVRPRSAADLWADFGVDEVG